MLILDNLSKQFAGKPPVAAVTGVDFSLQKGQFVAIVGRSGSGKSSLLGMLGGISRPTAGKILIDGTDQWALSNNDHCDFRNRKVGFVFQFASLLPTLRIIDNIALPALVGGTLSDREIYARARTLLFQVGLSDRADFYPHQLSGGQQRRAAIARALINFPDLLLADEPTADLDEETEQEILDLLIGIHKAFNLTMVVVTHNLEIAAKADHILQMQAGQIVSSRDGAGTTALESNSERLANAEQSEQIKRMFENTPAQLSTERMRIGDEFKSFIGRLSLLILTMLALVFTVNFAISQYEGMVIDQQAAAHQALEDLAMSGLRAEIKNITFGPGKSYIVSLYLKNTTDNQPIYVLTPSVRGFVQVGTSWQEVPLKPFDSAMPKVLKITSTNVYQYILEPNIADFTQIIPYYMHVRLSNDMIVSPSNQPKSNLIERNDNYYVYLKPHNINDATILTKLKFPGIPPIWIPMPPH